MTNIDNNTIIDNKSDLRVEIALLKQGMSNFDRYFTKIDNVMEKIGETLSKLTNMTALHEQRIESQILEEQKMLIMIDESRVEVQLSLKTLDNKIETIEKNLTEKIRKLELWRMLIIGGSLLAFYFFGDVVKRNFIKDPPPEIKIETTTTSSTKPGTVGTPAIPATPSVAAVPAIPAKKAFLWYKATPEIPGKAAIPAKKGVAAIPGTPSQTAPVTSVKIIIPSESRKNPE